MALWHTFERTCKQKMKFNVEGAGRGILSEEIQVVRVRRLGSNRGEQAIMRGRTVQRLYNWGNPSGARTHVTLLLGVEPDLLNSVILYSDACTRQPICTAV